MAYPPRVRLLEWSESHVVGEHEGYCRLRRPVIHRRRIERKNSNEWVIYDQFEGRGKHDFALNLQFAVGAEVGAEGDVGASVRWSEGVSLQVVPVSVPVESNASVETGWVSPGWNLKNEAPRYVLRWHSTVPVESRLILRLSSGL